MAERKDGTRDGFKGSGKTGQGEAEGEGREPEAAGKAEKKGGEPLAAGKAEGEGGEPEAEEEAESGQGCRGGGCWGECDG